MALYLLPTPRNGYAERPSRAIAASGVSTEDLVMPELHAASDVRPGEPPTKWKALQVKGIKGGMRWM
jgi:hypothetical protein